MYVWLHTNTNKIDLFYSRRRKFEKATIRFIISVRLSAWNNSASTGKIFIKFDISVIFENLRQNTSFTKIWQEQWVL
jgi:hypothetical protein